MPAAALALNAYMKKSLLCSGQASENYKIG